MGRPDEVDRHPFLHHQVIRQKLASLNRIIQRIAQNHVMPLTVMDPFERQFLAMADHLETNMEEQECWLFAWLRRIVKRGLAIGQDGYLEESLEEAMDQAAQANQEALDALDQIQMYDHLEREELFKSVRKFCQSCTKEEEMNHAY